MQWRPRALLAPFVVVVLLAVGTSATGAPPATAPSTDRGAECTDMPLARYGGPLPVEADRAADGAGQECYAFTAETTGPHDLRGWQAADPEEWQAWFEVRDAGTGELLAQETDWTGVEAYPRRQPTIVELVAGRKYEILVTGTPSVQSVTLVRYDPRYRLGVFDRTSTQGCAAAAPSGWQDPAVLGQVEDGEVTCHVVDRTGEWVRVDFRGDADLPHQVRGRLLDADGNLLTDREWSGTCRYSGNFADQSGAHACRLRAPGPYRFVVHAGSTLDEADYSLRTTDPADDTGCRPMSYALWSQPLPVSATLSAVGTDCWTMDLPRGSQHDVSLVEDGGWSERGVEMFGAEDGRPIGAHHESPAGSYRVIVSGNPGEGPAGYHLGIFDRQGSASDGHDLDVSCPVLESTSLAAAPATGRTAPGGYDCHRVPAGVDGPLLARMAQTQPGAPGARAWLGGGPHGWTECGASPGSVTRCDLARGSYRVMIGNRRGGPEAAPYAFSLSDPTNRAGCLPPRAAGPDAGLVVADLPADGARTCVALDDAEDRLLWSVDAPDDVRAAVIDRSGDDVCTYPPGNHGPELCRLRDFADHRAPFTVVLTNNGTEDRKARMFLRSDPAAERGCAPVSWSDGNGPMPLLGRTDGGLDAECHSLDMVSGGVLLNRTNLDGAEPPDVLVYDPTGRLICSDWGDDEPERWPDCYTSSANGRYVFWVLGDEDSVGRYRVDLGCDNLRVGCAQAPPVDFTRATLRGPVAVGRTLRAGIRGVPPRARVSWRWYVGDRVVRRAKAYTPAQADRGKRLRVHAVVTAPRYPKRTIRSGTRTVRAR